MNPELVVTIAWDISWYQYRVAPDSAQPVRLAERGHELDELDERYTAVERARRGGRPARPGHRTHLARLARAFVPTLRGR